MAQVGPLHHHGLRFQCAQRTRPTTSRGGAPSPTSSAGCRRAAHASVPREAGAASGGRCMHRLGFWHQVCIGLVEGGQAGHAGFEGTWRSAKGLLTRATARCSYSSRDRAMRCSWPTAFRSDADTRDAMDCTCGCNRGLCSSGQGQVWGGQDKSIERHARGLGPRFEG
jgi:hypothetical protein